MGVCKLSLSRASPLCSRRRRAPAPPRDRARLGGHSVSHSAEGHMPMTNATDPFTCSVIPFEVPEQMRAFAEKGVSQARDTYAKFKDAAESHNGTMEAVFSCANKGASAYSSKLM